MKIISFDVGIKNLAYCIIEVDEHKTYTICGWGILNLVNKPVFSCGSKQKKKPYAICGKSASYMDSAQNYYCKQHAKSCDFIVPIKELSDSALKRAKLSELKELATRFKLMYDTPVKKIDLFNKIQEFKKEHCLKPIVIEKAETGLVAMSINLTHLMDNLIKDHKIDCVLIENQISKIASTMKTIQGMITQYFVMIHVDDIHYISSYNKLKVFVESKKNYSYKERKDLGIKCARDEIIKTQHDGWVSIFNNHKKKDDLADSFLQALWYINVKMRTT
ncbi:MAG: hypothetical protein ACR2M6_00985 [Vampirovibrionia bacterium]